MMCENSYIPSVFRFGSFILLDGYQTTADALITFVVYSIRYWQAGITLQKPFRRRKMTDLSFSATLSGYYTLGLYREASQPAAVTGESFEYVAI